MCDKIKVIEYDIVGSTNTEAKEYARTASDKAPILFIAHEQSAGRGRLGRSFVSCKGKGIYMSLLYFTDAELSDAVSVTTAAAVYTATAIETCIKKPMKIKWVNDVYNERGKVAGILTETTVTACGNAVIVGIGINTGAEDFPMELSNIASSIGELDLGEEKMIIDMITENILRHANDPYNREYMTEYRKRSMLDGAYVDLIRAGERIGSGKVLGISDDGGLLFLADGDDEIEIIRSGEVSVRNIKR